MLKGSIRVGNIQSNIEDNYVQIEVTDELSDARFLQVKISYEQYGKMIAGNGEVECEFELRPKVVGMERQTKTVMIPVPNYAKIPPEQFAEVIKPYEVDGWKVSTYDLGNYKNYFGGEKDGYKCKVGCIRYVKP